MKEISIIIPVFNEEKTIANVINGIKNNNNDYEIIVVNDGSKDKTLEILNKIKGIKIINNQYNLGYGASIKKGIKESTGDLILIIDGDGTYPTDVIPQLLSYKNYDMVVGARTKKTNVPLLRKPAKWIITKLANFLSGKKIIDINSGLRVFKKNIALNFFHLFPSGFSFTTTLTLACLINDYTVKYIPIDYYKRKGKSSVHPKEFMNFITLIFRLIIYFKPLKIFFLISIILFITAIIIFLYSFFILKKVMDITIIVILLSSLQIFLFGILADLIVKRRGRKW